MNNTTSANPYTEIQSFSNTALICTVVVVFLFSLVLVAILAKRSKSTETISTSQNISQSSQSGPQISNHSPTHRETEVSRSPTLPIYRERKELESVFIMSQLM
jgi:cytoskeletal protein RodZ